MFTKTRTSYQSPCGLPRHVSATNWPTLAKRLKQRIPALRLFVFFFNDTATTEIYTLSLHDALPISQQLRPRRRWVLLQMTRPSPVRSEEHTSELQSLRHLVCRLLLEKKKNTIQKTDRTQTNRTGKIHSDAVAH